MHTPLGRQTDRQIGAHTHTHTQSCWTPTLEVLIQQL